MTLLDANVLIYAVNADSPHHRRSKAWLVQALSGTETVAFSWVALLAFLRLSTNPLVFPRPLKPDQALDIIESWLAQPTAVVLSPTERHLAVMRDLIDSVGTMGNLTTDTHLAALAVEHGARLCSTDRDFARFPGLRWLNPLQ